ncbi:hypothetical protein pipiens_010427 [Culex pipiens pipiens]|uniref:Uncharacterized protein n=1 Tax=Culex pipiens pipiens TaxID=38569 RepID=A0ABD1DAF0_CULPP
MALQLLKDYGSGSSSEEESAGFPAEAQVESTFPLSSSATSTDCNDSDGSFTNGPVLKKRKDLTEKAMYNDFVASSDARKTITAPAYTLEKAFRRQQNPVGISSERKDALINTISPLIEESKLIYWTSLAIKQT